MVAANEGLDPKNAADFVTYCLPMMREPDDKEADATQFVFQIVRDKEYDATFSTVDLVNAKVDYFHRFMLLWKKGAKQEEFERMTLPAKMPMWNANPTNIDWGSWEPMTPTGTGRTMVEWGSMQVY